MELKGWPRYAIFTLAWTVALFLLLPGLVAIPVAFNDSRFIALPTNGLSLRHFETLFTSGGWLASIGDSVGVALASTAIAVSFGTLCAVGLWRVTPWLAGVVAALLLAPMIFPPIVSALAFYRAWVAIGIYDTWIGVVLAHSILAIPYVIITVTTSLSLLDGRLEQAARSLGASPLRTLVDIIIPNIRTGIATAAVFAFIVSWDEIVVTMFVSSRAVYTLPRRMWDGIRENVDPTVAAVAAVLIAITAIGVLVAVASSWRRGGAKTS
jgi:putative spermidine/putrescine transport system permease protein